jgi:exosortase A-associated hydrolase 1
VFDCAGEQLVGILHLPSRPEAKLGVLFVVGGPQYRVGSHRQFTLMARELAAAGHAVFRFDYRGMGDSTGEARTFEHVQEDIAAALDAFFRAVPDMPGVVAFGLCDAASALLMQRGWDDRVRGLVLANPWVRTEATEASTVLRHYYARRLLDPAFWRSVFSGEFRLMRSAQSFLGSVGRAMRTPAGGDAAKPFIERMLAGASKFDRPVLLLLSGRDLTAREFERLCAQAPAWRAWINGRTVDQLDLPESDHTFSQAESLSRATEAMRAWLGRSPFERPTQQAK